MSFVLVVKFIYQWYLVKWGLSIAVAQLQISFIFDKKLQYDLSKPPCAVMMPCLIWFGH